MKIVPEEIGSGHTRGEGVGLPGYLRERAKEQILS